MKKPEDPWLIRNPKTGEIVAHCDMNDCCNSYLSSLCGGCGNCLAMQAEHAGFELIRPPDWVEPPPPYKGDIFW